MTGSTEITIRQPDDFHVHLRDGDLMERVLPYTAKVFGRALVMPNISPPVLTLRDAQRYAQRIVEAQAAGDLRNLWRQKFQPLMAIKLTDKTTPEIIQKAKSKGVIAAKLYPSGVTTNSADGVSDFVSEDLHKVFDAMAECGMVLCVHAETPGVPSLKRETHFITTWVLPWARKHPDLKIVIEHATTQHAVKVARDYGNIACSLTVHHMLLTIDDVIGDKLDPHCFCKPVAKSEADRLAIIEAAIGGAPDFFLGTDSAPHPVGDKHTAHAAAGCFTAPVAMELLTQVFDEHGSLGSLEMFASESGANFYGLPLNQGKIQLTKRENTIPPFADQPRDDGIGGRLIPFWAGRRTQWEVTEVIHDARETPSEG